MSTTTECTAAITLPTLPSFTGCEEDCRHPAWVNQLLLDYARAAVIVDRRMRTTTPSGTNVGPLAFRSDHSISPSFDRSEHQFQERQIALAERMGVKADLYRVDMGVLGEIYVKPEVASDRFKQLKRDRAPVKAVYPMYQGAALPNKVDALNPAGEPLP